MQTSSSRLFSGATSEPGVSWMINLSIIVSVIGVGWYAGRLQETTLIVIGVFVFLRGVVPYLKTMSALKVDKHRCFLEREQFIKAFSSAENVNKLLSFNTKDAGSVFLLFQAIQTSCLEGLDPIKATKLFLERFDNYWTERLSSLNEASDQSPVLGLGGSLLGFVSALGNFPIEGEGGGSLFAALATVSTTTLAGCCGYLLLSGLLMAANNAVEQHRADLQEIADQFNRGEKPCNQTDSDFNSNDLIF